MSFKSITSFEYEDFIFSDNWKSVAFVIGFCFILWTALTWIGTNIAGQTQVVLSFSSFLWLFVAAYAANLIKRGVEFLRPLPFGTISFGSNYLVIAVFCLLALGIGYVLVGQNLTIALPLDVTYKQTVSNMDYSYKVLISPSLEELFRAAAIIISALIVWLLSRNWPLALLSGLIFSSAIFGVFHWLAYQQAFIFIFSAIAFGFVSAALMLITKSFLPSIVLHWTNNQLIFSQGDPTGVFIAGIIFIAIIVALLIRRRPT